MKATLLKEKVCKSDNWKNSPNRIIVAIKVRNTINGESA